VASEQAIVKHSQFGAQFREKRGRWLLGIGGIAMVTLGLGAWAVTFGSPYYVWQYASGLRLTIEPTAVSIADAKVGQIRAVVVVARNLTNVPARVLGARATCTCFFASDSMPLDIPANGMKELHLTLDLRNQKAGLHEQSLVYFTDHPAAPRLKAAIVARVVDE
jgi:hypothetical protein